jgi:hypothetical protein
MVGCRLITARQIYQCTSGCIRRVILSLANDGPDWEKNRNSDMRFQQSGKLSAHKEG